MTGSSVALTSFEDYATIKYHYRPYIFGGFLPPIKSDGSSVFKLGSVIPVKFQLTDENGVFITTAIATFILQQYSNSEPIGGPIDATPAGSTDSGNLFRYDDTNNQYIFNLNTRSLSLGTWQIQVVLDDGTLPRTVFIGLK